MWPAGSWCGVAAVGERPVAARMRRRSAEVGGGVAVEEGGVGLFGQEFELGGLEPVIGVVASAVFIGGGEEGAAVDNGVCRGVSGYLCQLGEELVEFFRMRGCADVGKFCLRLEQVVDEGVFRGEEDVLPVPLRELFVEVREGEFGLSVVAILHAELPCKPALYPFAHQVVRCGRHVIEIWRFDVQRAQE